MATRRRTSAVKSTTVKKSPRTVVKKSTVTPQSVNKVTQIEEVNVTETADMIEIKLPEGTNLKKRPMNVEVDVKRRNISELNGLELVILPLVYLEGFVKLILKETGVTA